MEIFQSSDGGVDRPERKDCSVRALAIALDIPYWQAHDIMKWSGRRDNKGSYHTGDAYSAVGLKVFCLLPKKTIRKFLLTHKTGTYICNIRSHVFVVKNGIVYDKFLPSLGRRIYRIWSLT